MDKIPTLVTLNGGLKPEDLEPCACVVNQREDRPLKISTALSEVSLVLGSRCSLSFAFFLPSSFFFLSLFLSHALYMRVHVLFLSCPLAHSLFLSLGFCQFLSQAFTLSLSFFLSLFLSMKFSFSRPLYFSLHIVHVAVLSTGP